MRGLTMCCKVCLLLTAYFTPYASAQDNAQPPLLEHRLLQERPAALANDAKRFGDPARGALLFYRPQMVCTKCHATGEKESPVGPDLAKIDKKKTGEYLVNSLLRPSKDIDKKFISISAVTKKGKVITGLVIKDGAKLVIRDASGIQHDIPKADIIKRFPVKTSLMPTGLANQLSNRQEFLDLVKFVMEIKDGGPLRAQELRPPESFFAAAPLPEYEKKLDHSGMLRDLGADQFKRGEAIYTQICANCHGTHNKEGSLPTSLPFAKGKFKNGSDPFSMYKTLTHGFGMMVAQRNLVPQQKYDVIHYIREAYLKKHNLSQYVAIDKEYFAKLPKGTSRGPKPSDLAIWSRMNYGPHLTATYEVGRDGGNFAYTGIAVRLDPGRGGVSQGRHWMLFDHDTMRMSAAWSGKGFIDWNAILFNGRHAIHPRLNGKVHAANPTGPGWGKPSDSTFTDVRLIGKDGKRYGPLPKSWATYKGIYHYGDKVIVSYAIGSTQILEMPGLEATSPQPMFSRTFHIGPRDRDLNLQVAHQPNAELTIGKSYVALPPPTRQGKKPPGKGKFEFDGKTHLQIKNAGDFDMTGRDYTIVARLRTRAGGTIFCKTTPGPKWVRDGKTLFVRNGRLCFDIGWVGVVTSKRRVDDGRWYDVAMTWNHKNGEVRLYVNGELEKTKRLKPKRRVDGSVVRIGFTAPNFPAPSYFIGTIQELRFYQRLMSEKEFAGIAKKDGLIAAWSPKKATATALPDISGKKHDADIVRGKIPDSQARGYLLAGLRNGPPNVRWHLKDGNLRLRIPAGNEALKFTLWFGRVSEQKNMPALLSSLPKSERVLDLTALTKGGPRRWEATVQTMSDLGDDKGPLAVDVLHRPATNPWHCRVRPTGFDFFEDGDTAAVCCWDGDVWLVRSVEHPEKGLTWQRIASGLFQPLGLKIVQGQIYVLCRDQIVILRDLNGDGETDFYENFNSDHQVTDHFHEFAMDLQIDAEGNFYYARGARHALTALVPHHGTLLKVSKDGKKTEILANGFRAPNGVCLNPDGTFFVTDQEGHWNPKNRVNWVKKGGFYGNMFGYHNVKDESDSAMEQPLCWITNSFDRSPSELLWVTSKKWGPLTGSLLNLSYGYGKVFVVPHETIGGMMQGGMVELPLPRFPTGVMRGRFHPKNGHLYMCGMYAWAGNQQQPGGFYRLRYTGKPLHVPVKLSAQKKGLALTFSGELDCKIASDPENYAVKVWSLKRTRNYGSKHYNERRLNVTGAKLAKDGKSVFLTIPEIAPTWCMEIRYALRGAGGEAVQGRVHNTIHRLK